MPQGKKTGEAQPTMEDVEAIGNAAATAATEETERGGNADAAGQAAATAANEAARARDIHLPQEVIDQIARAAATATVAELAAQGAVEASPPAAEQPETPEDEETPAGTPPAPVEPEVAPRKKTLAERLLSQYRKDV